MKSVHVSEERGRKAQEKGRARAKVLRWEVAGELESRPKGLKSVNQSRCDKVPHRD